MTTTTFVDGVTQSAAAWANDADTAAYSALTTVAGTNTITATGPANYALSYRIPFSFIPAATNTGATTLNISATGAKNVFSGGVACTGGELVIGVPVLVIYDGTQYNIINSGATTRGSFTATLTGCTTSPTATGVYSITNNVVTLYIPALNATSNTTACTITGLPAAIRPATTHGSIVCAVVLDNSSGNVGGVDVNTDGSLTLFIGAHGITFTGSGTKGLSQGVTVTYNLN